MRRTGSSAPISCCGTTSRGGNFLANQKKWMGDLEGFLTKFGKSDEAPEVWLQLGSSQRVQRRGRQGQGRLHQAGRDFPDTPAGKKAAGALRRLDLVGKTISIKGTSLQGETIDTSQYRGKSVLVVFWASWGGQSVRASFPDLVKLVREVPGQGTSRSSASVWTTRRRDLDAFLKEQPIAWPQIFEPGRNRQPAGDRVRDHLVADDVPDRRPGQGGEPQHPNGRRAGASAREAGVPEAARRRPRRSLSWRRARFTKPREWPEAAFPRGGLRSSTPCGTTPGVRPPLPEDRASFARRPSSPTVPGEDPEIAAGRPVRRPVPFVNHREAEARHRGLGDQIHLVILVEKRVNSREPQKSTKPARRHRSPYIGLQSPGRRS